MTARHIAIVGAGFSGTTLAVRLLEILRGPGTISLIDATGRFGAGLAYGTEHPAHVMNTPASAISATFGEPDQFAAWLAAQNGAGGSEPAAFAPTRLYGRYLGELLDRAERRSDIALVRVADEVIDVGRTAAGFAIRFASGCRLAADTVVVASGYGLRQPRARQSRIVLDPWAGDWWSRVSPTDSVLIRGTGLSMIDQVLRLRASGHEGPVVAVSRRGLLPRRHPGTPAPERAAPSSATLGVLARAVHREAREANRRGHPWQPAVDRLRPATQEIWSSLSGAERARFERHLRPYWNVHRHRMAPLVAEAVDELLASGRLAVHAGRLEAVSEEPGVVKAAFRRRGTRTTEIRTANWLIDCSAIDRYGSSDALGWSLFCQGLATRNGEALAFNVDRNARFSDRDGALVDGLFGIGPVARPALGEITAIPEIRTQCFALAEEIAARPARHAARPAESRAAYGRLVR